MISAIESVQKSTNRMRDRVIKEQVLEPGRSTAFGAPYNASTHRPRLTVRVIVPQHVMSQVKVEGKTLGKREEPQKCHMSFTVKNESSYPAVLRFVEELDDEESTGSPPLEPA
jgi:hypothetical protein